MAKRFEGAILGVVVAILVLGIDLTGALSYLEHSFVDFRFHAFPDESGFSDEVVVLEIDKETVARFQELGYVLPLSRQAWTELLDPVAKLGPRAIVIDLAWGDLRHTALALARSDDPFVLEPGTDSQNLAFAKSEAGAGSVVIGVTANEAAVRDSSQRLALAKFRKTREGIRPWLDARLVPVAGGPITEQSGEGMLLEFPEPFVLAGARAVGYVVDEHVRDVDGRLRRFAPATRIDGFDVVDLSVAAVAVARSELIRSPPWIETHPPLPGVWPPPLPALVIERGHARIAGATARVDAQGFAWIRWRGRWADKFPRVSAARALDAADSILLDDPPPALVTSLANKVVVIGFTIQGAQSDLTPTPFGTQPGVFAVAAKIDTLLTGDALRSPPPSFGFLSTFAAAIAVGVVVLRKRQRKERTAAWRMVGEAMVPGVAIFSITLVAGFACFRTGWVVELVRPLASIAFASLAGAAVSVARRRTEGESYLALARRGLGADVVDELLATRPDLIPQLGGKRVNLTVYFSDIAGFTTLSEELEPEALVAVLNDYLRRVSTLLTMKHGAFLDKYIGDAVMCFWGAPVPAPDGPARAALAALDVMELLKEFSAELEAKGMKPLRTRIGINTGPAIAAFVGLPEKRFYYTALGDTVNLASRLEGASKAYGTSCLLGSETYEGAKHAVLAREIDLVKVKGKNIAVRVYEPLGRAGDPLVREREVKRRYEAALKWYRGREFGKARHEFLALVTEFGDPPSKTLALSCDERIAGPPPEDWDGSNELHEK